MDNSALRPSNLDTMRALWETKKKDDDKGLGIDPEDASLATMSETTGWPIFKKHIETLKAGLDSKLAQAVASGMSEVEVGKSAVMAVIAKDLLDSLIHKVEDSALAVEQIRQDGQSGAGGEGNTG